MEKTVLVSCVEEIYPVVANPVIELANCVEEIYPVVANPSRVDVSCVVDIYPDVAKPVTVLVSWVVDRYPRLANPVKEDASSSDFPNDVLANFVSMENTVLVSCVEET